MSWSLTTSVIPDSACPSVSAVFPANPTTGVGITAQLATTFSEPMDASTINTSTFTLKQGTTPVAGTVSYSGVDRNSVVEGKRVDLGARRIIKKKRSKDLAGNALSTDMSWSFTTGVIPDTSATTVSATVPADATTGVGITDQLATTFSEPMDASTINTSTFILKQGTTPVAGTVSYSGVTATFTPAANLAPLTPYTATTNTGTKDLAGNALTTDMSRSLTT